MDRRIRYLGLFLVLCFGVLFVELNNLQIAQAPRLLANPTEQALQAPRNEFSEPRGDIVTADGVVLAKSSPSKDAIGEQRSYPQGPLFADVTGYYDAVDFAATGVEAEYDNDLADHESTASTPRQILTEQSGTDNVVLTINASLQKVAQQALGGRLGAIVALNPQTGAVYAMYGNPSFDPNAMASHDSTAVAAYYAKNYTAYANAHNAAGAPLTNQVTEHTYAPGSTEKVITTAAIYDHHPALAQMVWPYLGSTLLPESNIPLHNFGGETCGGTLIEILTVSCDTAFALAGVQLGGPALVAEAQAFGFNQVPPIDLEVAGAQQAVASSFPPASQIEANGTGNVLAGYSAIGQDDVQQSVLGNALVAAAIADGGTMMAPHVMAQVLDDTGRLVASYKPHPWLQSTSPATAAQVRADMLNVVAHGTAVGVGFPAADDVAAKTGTAETEGGCTANWLIATAPAGSQDTPSVAVAAVIPAQPGVACNSEETTGATVAGPAVKQLLTATLAMTH